ncbi:hypothetical protein TraAM80_05731 [Trypanosoma rangeli]|uniref:Uncharacterized protein n=1 Tax=Trypanosoma rangeli TaxID=5698 RepID=A0A3R7MJE9_TRYRA|nr:uncharacterized protein TraAM80_05731 [Trypanosoma rangeli]RNF03572.1 hypothetical protein TraAM80_05731 [Trypanosoma rangeli]|eukprot:RNF03572.1 hypothetical protein TraAM80_05731 [Trypanosoma rangeli]
MRSASNLRAAAQEATDRSLPSFDNHYNNGVLIDNWQEGRIYDESGRKFTLAMDHPVGPPCTVYKADYSNQGRTSLQPMMRPRGLGKELILGEGKTTTLEWIPTSTTYGETQQHFINSKYGRSRRSTGQLNTTVREIYGHTFSDSPNASKQCSTADEDNYGRFNTTKTVMDIPVESYHFQRQMAQNQKPQ